MKLTPEDVAKWLMAHPKEALKLISELKIASEWLRWGRDAIPNPSPEDDFGPGAGARHVHNSDFDLVYVSEDADNPGTWYYEISLSMTSGEPVVSGFTSRAEAEAAADAALVARGWVLA